MSDPLDMIEELQEMLRQLVMDQGRCDRPKVCDCSTARAFRMVAPDDDDLAAIIMERRW